MNKSKGKPNENEVKKEIKSQTESPNVVADVCMKEEVDLNEPNKDSLTGIKNYPEGHNPKLFTSTEKAGMAEEETQSNNLDALLSAWWKYKRANKQKKKKKKKIKILEIYRDENYWDDGRYTDDEDFIYEE